jgi:hypothetical protein
MSTDARKIDDFEILSGEQISSRLHEVRHNILPVPIKRPWKMIGLIFFLMFCGGFFLVISYYNWKVGKSLSDILPPLILAFLLLVASLYHFAILILIMIGYKDYTYDLLQVVH